MIAVFSRSRERRPKSVDAVLGVRLQLVAGRVHARPVGPLRVGELVAERRDVDLDAGIAVPVPGAADAVAGLEQDEVLEARAAQRDGRADAREPGADDRDVDIGLGGHARIMTIPAAMMRHDNVAPKIVYIAGWKRSGSTILDQYLGQAGGWLACGELRLLWKDYRCGCGAAVRECAVWGPALEAALGRHGLAFEDVQALHERAVGAGPFTFAAALRTRRALRDEDSAARRYGALLGDLYRGAAREAGARVLVDSSKTASDALVVARATGLQAHVVHLVRDPRAGAYSLNRPKLPGMGPLRSSVNWLRTHAAIEATVRPALRVRYEDFAADPRAVARRIWTLVDDREPQPADGPNHMTAGNPVRFAAGHHEIRLDDEWRTRMPLPARLAATLPALPLLHRYDYPLHGRST